MGERGNRIRLRAAALVLILCLALTPLCAYAEGTKTDFLSGAPKVTMEIAEFNPSACKLTLYGTGALLDYWRSNVPNYQCVFRYNIRFSGEREIDLHGRLRYYHYEDQATESIQWISSILECKNITYDVSRANTKSPDKISWTIWFPQWMHFGKANMKSVEFQLFNGYDTRQKVTETFSPDDVFTDVMLREDLVSGGSVEVTAPGAKPGVPSTAQIVITDPDLAAGYTNSAGGKGELKPVWHIKMACGSYTWVEATVDGSGGQALDKMDFSAGYFQLNKDKSNKYNAVPTDMTKDCSYSVSGDKLTIKLNPPSDFWQGLEYMYWIQVDMHGGAVSHKYKLQ